MQSRVFVRRQIREPYSQGGMRKDADERASLLQRLSKGGIALVLICVGLSVIAHLTPRVDIVVIPETREVRGVLPVTFDSTAETVTADRMRASHVTEPFRREMTVPTTGSIDIGKKSRGSVLLTNRTGVDFPLLAGHLIRGGDTMYYTPIADVLIPKASVSPEGEIIPGTIEVEVEAVEGGEKTALAAGRIVSLTTVPPERQDKIFGYVSREIKGGSSNRVQSVAEQDVSAALDQLIREVRTTARQEIASHYGEEYIVLDELLFVSPSASSSVPAVFEPARDVTVRLDAEVVGVAVKRKDLESVILKEAVSAAKLEPSERLSSRFDYRIEQPVMMDERAYKVKSVVSYTIDVVPEFSLEDIARQVVGMPEHKARQLILSQKGVKDVRINQRWNLFSTFPHHPKKIHISVQY